MYVCVKALSKNTSYIFPERKITYRNTKFEYVI